jgi:hypothetical protein
MRALRSASTAIVLALSLSACATIMHGSSQEVGISSTPTSATVTVDDKELGKTPVVAKLKRKQNHIVKINLDGYKPYETTLTRKTSGWVWGNIVFGGLIGLAVDAGTGSLYKLTPEQVAAQLPAGTTAKLAKDGIYVIVALEPGADWQKVGQLERVGSAVATR